MPSRNGQESVRRVLAANGVVFLVRALTNLTRPTSFFLDADAAPNAVDSIHVMGLTQVALGLTQLGIASSADVGSLRAAALASQLFAAGMAVKTLTMGRDSVDRFHRIRYGAAAENLFVVGLLGVALRRLETARNV